jgi:hypothetical protein
VQTLVVLLVVLPTGCRGVGVPQRGGGGVIEGGVVMLCDANGIFHHRFHAQVAWGRGESSVGARVAWRSRRQHRCRRRRGRGRFANGIKEEGVY